MHFRLGWLAAILAVWRLLDPEHPYHPVRPERTLRERFAWLVRAPSVSRRAKIPEVLPLPDLLSVQHDSFGWFLERGLREIFEEVSPIEDFTGTLALELTDHRFDEPTLTIEQAKARDANYSRPLFVTTRSS